MQIAYSQYLNNSLWIYFVVATEAPNTLFIAINIFETIPANSVFSFSELIFSKKLKNL